MADARFGVVIVEVDVGEVVAEKKEYVTSDLIASLNGQYTVTL